MAPRIVDEREHRRGLVLGLTLAEILLLLIFLLMLALSIPLKIKMDAIREAEAELVDLRVLVSELRPLIEELQAGHESKMRDLADRLKAIRGLEDSLNLDISSAGELLPLMKPFLSGSAEANALKRFLLAAAKIDPNDPPMALERATTFLEITSSNLHPPLIKSLQDVFKDTERLKSLHAAFQAASKLDPDDPPAVLNSGLQIIEGLRSSGLEHGRLNLITLGKIVQVGLNAASKGDHSWPPIINLSEAGGYFFRIGSAELSEGFERKLREAVFPRLLQIAQEYRTDTIEVIGHTDEQAIAPRPSNLDRILFSVLKGSEAVSTLIPADNAGLGLARAVAVVRVLQADPRMEAFRVLPMSGAQLITVDERITKGEQGNIKERRRIEIRLRRSQARAVVPDTDMKH